MKIELNYIKSLTDSELQREWKSRGYKEYHSKIGKVAGLGWGSMEALTNYTNYFNEMRERNLL